MKQKTRKNIPYIVLPIIFFLVFVVYFGISVARYKVGEANGVVDVPKDAQTIEFMEIGIGAEIYTNDDELDQSVPYYFYIGGEWFAPDTEYAFTAWELEGNAVFQGTDVIEQFTWTYEGAADDEVYQQMVADLSVDFGEATAENGTYTWTATADHDLGINDKAGSVVLSRDDQGVSIHCEMK